ncbi:MAG: RlmE family RNA methyltransferase [Pseudomonadota bacterium]
MSGRKGNPYEKIDARTKQAKAQGFPARSVFKLEEIDRRVKLLRGGQKVLDLGAAPGSWSLYASQKVGPGGRVLAIDLQQIQQGFPPNVRVAQGDALTLENSELAAFAPYDVVLSDMAPNTSGTKVRDQAYSFELCMRALDVALALGKPGSHFVAKIFMSNDFQAARKVAGERYERVQVIRPEGTRAVSSEVFIVGMGLKKPVIDADSAGSAAQEHPTQED